MKHKEHHYSILVKWDGNTGNGTSTYHSYKRDFTVYAENKVPVTGSSDPSFLGDKTKFNPEELLLSSVSTCHMLWYLHLCAESGIIVEEYHDKAFGIMQEKSDGSGQFISITLQPKIKITAESDVQKALALHTKANKMCFIANSLNFNIMHHPSIEI